MGPSNADALNYSEVSGQIFQVAFLTLFPKGLLYKTEENHIAKTLLHV